MTELRQKLHRALSDIRNIIADFVDLGAAWWRHDR